MIKRIILCNQTQHDAITKIGEEVDSKADVLSFSVTHCFANLFLFLRAETQTRYSIARASTKIFMEKDRFAVLVSKDCRFVFTRACKRFTDYFAVANRNRLADCSCVCGRVRYQTLGLYCGKTGQALTSSLTCVFVCLVINFDQNLSISGVENEVLLKLVKYFEMSLLQSRENKQFC